MDVTWYSVLIFTIFLAGISFSIGLYIWSREFYLKRRVAIRKIYYGSVVASSFALWLFDAFPNVGKDFKTLIAIVIGVVVIDLFVFQTPDITKFMSNELKQEGLVETINKNRGSFIELSEKLIQVNEIMPRNLSDWQIGEFPNTAEKYEEDVVSYLRTFASSFHLDIFSYLVESDSDEEQFKANVAAVYERILEEHELTYRKVGMRKNQAIKTLLEGENIEIIESESSSVLFPYFGEYYNLFFLVRSRKKNDVTGADASLMLNLLYTFDLWLQANEDELLFDDEEDDSEDTDTSDGNQ